MTQITAEAADIEITGVHPYADQYPMLPAEELDELTASIAANGLRAPIVVTPEGLILDGRNRWAACQSLGLVPEVTVYEGDDLAEYVIDCNTTRRHLSTGQRAMASALVLAADGRRENGRWKRGSVAISEPANSGWKDRLKEAGVVLDYAPELAAEVVSGEATLNAAFTEADERRRSEQAEELARKAEERRQREAAEAKAAADAKIVADLTAADSKYVELISAGTLTPDAAWAAHQKDTEHERRKQRDRERGIRDTCNNIADAVSCLAPGGDGDAYARIYLEGFHPHASKYVAEGNGLTKGRVRSAIAFLQAVEPEVSL